MIVTQHTMDDKDTFYSHISAVCTERRAVASEHRNKNLAITNQMRCRYITSFVVENF